MSGSIVLMAITWQGVMLLPVLASGLHPTPGHATFAANPETNFQNIWHLRGKRENANENTTIIETEDEITETKGLDEGKERREERAKQEKEFRENMLEEWTKWAQSVEQKQKEWRLTKAEERRNITKKFEAKLQELKNSYGNETDKLTDGRRQKISDLLKKKNQQLYDINIKFEHLEEELLQNFTREKNEFNEKYANGTLNKMLEEERKEMRLRQERQTVELRREKQREISEMVKSGNEELRAIREETELERRELTRKFRMQLEQLGDELREEIVTHAIRVAEEGRTLGEDIRAEREKKQQDFRQQHREMQDRYRQQG